MSILKSDAHLRSFKNRPSLSVDWNTVFGKSEERASQKHEGFTLEEKPTVHFVLGSKYKGEWNRLGMAGFGTYEFPVVGTEFEGYLSDGMFNGPGVLTYANKQRVDGFWKNDRFESLQYAFKDGLEYQEPWDYCRWPDRRFWTSITEGLRPGGRELLTNDYPARKIPDGCYDTGDGFYNPKTRDIVSPTDPDEIIRIPTQSEENWIIENCRKAWDEPTGYRPDLYERWTTGRHSEEFDYDTFEEKEMHSVRLE